MRFVFVGLALIVILNTTMLLHWNHNSGISSLGSRYSYSWDHSGRTWVGAIGPKRGKIRTWVLGEKYHDPAPGHLGEAGPHVDRYRVLDRVIVGHVEAWAGNGMSPGDDQWDASKPGYFIIDVRADQTYHGLTKRQWLAQLHGYGIHTAPELFTATVFDSYIGTNKPQGYRDR